jgi:hypothetical protein
MAMVCPKCQATFAQRLDCPKCGCRLVFPDKATLAGGPFWTLPRLTPWISPLLGLLLAQGTYHGLRQLAVAVAVVAGGAEAAERFGPGRAVGLVLGQAFLALGLVLGGLVAGAGRKRAVLIGAGLGAVNAVVYLLGQQLFSHPVSTVAWYGQPIVQAAFGALGGFLGARLWDAEPILPPTPSLLDLSRPLPQPRPARKHTGIAGPVAWGRVLVGMVVAVGGNWWAGVILQFVYAASDYKLAPQTGFQDRFLTWELAIIAIFTGAAYAGANTRNGLKQGWMVGLATGVTLIVIYILSQGQYAPLPGSGLRDLFGLTIHDLSYPMQILLFTLAVTLSVGLLGGWFGGELLPPVVAHPRRRGLGPLSW